MQGIRPYLFLIGCLFLADINCANAVEQGVQQKQRDAATASSSPVKADPKTAGQDSSRKIAVAKVNGVEISMHALIQMMNRLGVKKEEAGAPAQDIDAVRKEALDRLILQELAYQEAKKRGLKADPAAVRAALANVRENAGGEEGFAEFLQKEQVTEQELTAQVERSLTLEKIYAREVFEKVQIPEEEIRQAYEREKGKYIKPEKISIIDVFFPSKDGSQALAQHAATIRKKIMQDLHGDPWQLVLDKTFDVRTYSPRPEKDRELIQEARRIKQDEISGVIKAPDGFHIIKLRDYSPERQMTFEEVKPRLENQLRVPAQDKRLQEWEQELRKNAVIEVL